VPQPIAFGAVPYVPPVSRTPDVAASAAAEESIDQTPSQPAPLSVTAATVQQANSSADADQSTAPAKQVSQQPVLSAVAATDAASQIVSSDATVRFAQLSKFTLASGESPLFTPVATSTPPVIATIAEAANDGTATAASQLPTIFTATASSGPQVNSPASTAASPAIHWSGVPAQSVQHDTIARASRQAIFAVATTSSLRANPARVTPLSTSSQSASQQPTASDSTAALPQPPSPASGSVGSAAQTDSAAIPVQTTAAASSNDAAQADLGGSPLSWFAQSSSTGFLNASFAASAAPIVSAKPNQAQSSTVSGKQNDAQPASADGRQVAAAAPSTDAQPQASSPSQAGTATVPLTAPVPVASQEAALPNVAPSRQTVGTRASAQSPGTFPYSRNSSAPGEPHTSSAASVMPEAPTVSPQVAGASEATPAPAKPANQRSAVTSDAGREVQSAAPAAPATTTQTASIPPTAGPQIAGEMFLAQAVQVASGTAPSVLPIKGDSIQSAGKPAQKVSNDGPGKSSDLAVTTDKSRTAVPAADSSSNNAQTGSQTGGQSAQHAQSDNSQPIAVAAKVADTTVAQAPVIATHAAAHDAAATPRTPDSSTDASRPNLPQAGAASSHADGDDTAGSSGINSARVIQSMSESEMRVGMHSSEFGNISIRTSVSQQQMQAQISLDHSDLSQAIASHITNVQTKLGSEYGLNASIQVNHQGASTSGQSGDSQPREQRAFTPSARTEGNVDSAEQDISITPAAAISTGSGYRLDIQA